MAVVLAAALCETSLSQNLYTDGADILLRDIVDKFVVVSRAEGSGYYITERHNSEAYL